MKQGSEEETLSSDVDVYMNRQQDLNKRKLDGGAGSVMTKGKYN